MITGPCHTDLECQMMPKMTTILCHNVQTRHIIPETTPEMTSDTHRSRVPLREERKFLEK